MTIGNNYSTIERVAFNLELIEKLIYSKKYAIVNGSNNIKRFYLSKRFEEVKNRLAKYDTKQVVLFNKEVNFDKLIAMWNKFEEHFDGKESVENKEQYGLLVKYTVLVLGYLKSVPIDKTPVSNENIKISSDVEQKKLDDINTRRAKLKEALEKAKVEDPVDNEKVKRLQSQLDKMNATFMAIREKVEDAKIDSEAKSTLKTDIDSAFKDLGAYTIKIDDELNRLRIEYWAALITLGVIILCILVGYFVFICKVVSKAIVINNPWDVLPYSLGLGICIGLIVVCLYLKGRANKISIELSTRLFNIHYLKGLMNMTSKLSANYGEAVIRINDIIGVLERSYIRRINQNTVTEKQLTTWEKKEIKNSPYLKLLIEIKELLTKSEMK